MLPWLRRACGATVILLLAAAYALSAVASGDFEELIGLAGIHPVEGACLAIRVPGLPEGTVVTLVEPQARKILNARITGQLEGSCVSGSAIPGLVGAHDDSTYRLEILKGNPRDYDVFIATLIPQTELIVRDDYVRADLDRDGAEESFRACLSAEGLHLTIWSGLPFQGERRWHRYHYLGYELDESAQNCTKADYESGTAVSSQTELQAYNPNLTIVRESNRSFGYDSTVLDRELGEKVAEYFYAEFGQDEFPLVYRMPGQPDVYLVSAVNDHRGRTDFGRRFFLVHDEGETFRTVYRGKGMSDSYILRPAFYTGDDKVLILAEVGTEYSWGLVAYELVGSTIEYLGPLNVAAWSGEDFVNPLARSKVTSGKEGFQVQFYSDLTMDPGGTYQWTLPKLKESISFVETRGRFVLDDDSVGNQACFFFIDDARVETADRGDVSSDFAYFFDQLVPWLERQRISYSFQTDLPLRMIAAGHSEVTISGMELEQPFGVVLMLPGGSRKIIYGAHTGVDLALDMTMFFALSQRAE